MRSRGVWIAGIAMFLGIPPGNVATAHADPVCAPLDQEVRRFLSEMEEGFASRLREFIDGLMAKRDEENQRLQSQLTLREAEVRKLEDEVLDLRCRVSELEVELALQDDTIEPLEDESAVEVTPALPEKEPVDSPWWIYGKDDLDGAGASPKKEESVRESEPLPWREADLLPEPVIEPGPAPTPAPEPIPILDPTPMPADPAPVAPPVSSDPPIADPFVVPSETVSPPAPPQEDPPVSESPALAPAESPAVDVPSLDAPGIDPPRDDKFWDRYMPWLRRAPWGSHDESAEPVKETTAPSVEGEGASPDADPAKGNAGETSGLPQHEPSSAPRAPEEAARPAEASTESAPECLATPPVIEPAPTEWKPISPEGTAVPAPAEVPPIEAAPLSPPLIVDPPAGPEQNAIDATTD